MKMQASVHGSQRAAFEMAPSSCSSVTVATRRRTGGAAARTSWPPGTVPAHGEAAEPGGMRRLLFVCQSE